MKFRQKVLICNIIFVAIAFAVSGYLLIRYNYRMSIERSFNSALEENQLLRATIEADITNRILREDYESLADIDQLRKSIENKLQGTQTEVQLIKQENLAEDSPYYAMVSDLESGQKNYMVLETEEGYVLVCASTLGIEKTKVYIINTKNITDVYESMNMQIRYFRIIMIVAVVVCSVIMYFISLYLTRSIKSLTRVTRKMAAGNYGIRSRVESRDEIGELSHYFNKMADSVEQHVAELQEENRRREDFVANFTHEIKTPLTAVIGYSDMLRSKRMSEENMQIAADYIFSEGKRLESMSMKLFDLILLDKTEITKKRIFIPDLMESVSRSAGPLAQKRGVNLISKPCDTWIMGDKDLLKTVFINMLDNAAKASAEGGSIVFRARHKSGVVLMEVEDRGIGIPKAEVERITEAFYMVDKSRSRKSGGAGLGLALASKIVELHGGKLKIVSEVNVGTCMQVYFREVSADASQE